MKKKFFLLTLYLGLLGCSTVQDKKQAEYALLRGVNFEKNEKYSEAMREFKNSYSKNPKNVILLREMGYTYYKMGQFDKSEEYWKKALKLIENDEITIKNLATLYYEQGDYKKATVLIESVVKYKDSYLNQLYGMILVKEGAKEKAFQELDKINFDDFTVQGYIVYLELKALYDKSNLKSALNKGYDKFKLQKDFVITYGNYIYEYEKDFDRAETALLNYLTDVKIDNDVILTLSKLYEKHNDKDKAKQILRLKN